MLTRHGSLIDKFEKCIKNALLNDSNFLPSQRMCSLISIKCTDWQKREQGLELCSYDILISMITI